MRATPLSRGMFAQEARDRVFATVPAVILIQPPTNVTALDGKDATISCTAEGSPAPNVTWYFNGEEESLYPNQTNNLQLCLST